MTWFSKRGNFVRSSYWGGRFSRTTYLTTLQWQEPVYERPVRGVDWTVTAGSEAMVMVACRCVAKLFMKD